MSEASGVHPLTLRFRATGWERAFVDDHYAKSLLPLRVAAAVSAVVLTVLGVLGLAFQPERLPNPVLAMAPAASSLAVLGAAFAPWFKRWMPLVLAAWVLFLTATIQGAFVLTRDLPDTPVASAVGLLVGLITIAMIRLPFAYAAPTAVLMTGGWLALGVGFGLYSQTVVPALVSSGLLGTLIAAYFSERTARRALVATRLLDAERDRSERLLLNVLPGPIAERLKAGEEPIADAHEEVTVLFADIVDFTGTAARCTPDELVMTLNGVFTEFDRLAARHGLEKIKTVGDAYMAVAGLPEPRPDHADAAAELALDMIRVLGGRTAPTGEPLRVRIGINTGPVVAGVIGTAKFAYDLWGDAVNTASRMESHGVPGAVQVTRATYERLRDRYAFEERGEVEVKGKGPMPAYVLLGRRESGAVAGRVATRGG